MLFKMNAFKIFFFYCSDLDLIITVGFLLKFTFVLFDLFSSENIFHTLAE